MLAPVATAPYAHIACFVDDTDAAQRALDEAVRLRSFGEGRLSVVHVVAPPPWPLALGASFGGVLSDPDALAGAAQAWLEELVRPLPGAEAIVLRGHPAEEASRFVAEAGCDLAVAATHRGSVARALLGSFASHLAHHAPCAVLLVRPAASA